MDSTINLSVKGLGYRPPVMQFLSKCMSLMIFVEFGLMASRLHASSDSG